MKVLIVIPAYNEEENIKRVVDNLTQNYPQYDYVVVNDGSKDGTAQICRDNGFSLVDLPVNLGLSGAFQTGLRFAAKHGYDAALQFDADGQHLPEYIPSMVECMDITDRDIVIGSRFADKPKPKSMRMLGSNLIAFAMKITTGYSLKDPTSGMRIFNRRMIEEFSRDPNYTPEPDTVSYLMRNGAVVKEVQVEMAERIAGESYLNPINAVKYMFKMFVSILLVQWFRKRG